VHGPDEGLQLSASCASDSVGSGEPAPLTMPSGPTISPEMGRMENHGRTDRGLLSERNGAAAGRCVGARLLGKKTIAASASSRMVRPWIGMQPACEILGR